MQALRRTAMREGRNAALARLHGGPVPVNPYRKGTKSRSWWNDGADHAGRLIDRILEIGA